MYYSEGRTWEEHLAALAAIPLVGQAARGIATAAKVGAKTVSYGAKAAKAVAVTNKFTRGAAKLAGNAYKGIGSAAKGVGKGFQKVLRGIDKVKCKITGNCFVAGTSVLVYEQVDRLDPAFVEYDIPSMRRGEFKNAQFWVALTAAGLVVVIAKNSKGKKSRRKGAGRLLVEQFTDDNIEAIENDPNEIFRLGLFEAYDSPIDSAEKDDELLLPTAQPEFALELESDESPYSEIIVSANGESEYDRTDVSVVDTADDFSGSESFSHLSNTVSVITSSLPDSQSKSEMHEMNSSLSETKVDNNAIESRSKGDRKPLSDRFDFVDLPESPTSRSASAVQLAADQLEDKTNSNWWTNVCGLLLVGLFACFAISSITSNNKIDSAADLNHATAAGTVSRDEGSSLDRLSQSPLVQSDLAENSGWKLAKLNIEDIQVGMRVPAQNPLEEEIENESIDREVWRKVRLKMNRGNGSEMQITLLRSEAWIRESLVLANGLTALDQGAIGQRIEFNVDELDAEGFAEILSVDPCPEIIDGPGEVVTATYHSKSVPVIDLEIDGLNEPLGVTHDHPIWSEDRHDFVKAGELQHGETLQLIDDQLVRLTNTEPRAGPEDVFNFEVANQHVYFVGDNGLLVHNASQGVYLSQLTRLEKMRDAADAAGDATKVAKIDALILKTGQKLHGNSTKFTGAQEGYAIVNSLTGEILKVGVTNAKIGVKARHAQQAANVTKLTGVKEANQILVKLKDIPAKANARGDILKWEKDFSGFMLGTGNPLPAHKTPRIPFFFN